MTRQGALEFLFRQLTSSPAKHWFDWEPLVEGDLSVLRRTPKEGGEMAKQPVALIHICRPVCLYEAIRDNEAEATSACSGFITERDEVAEVWDKDLDEFTGELRAVVKGTCWRCDTVVA